MALSMKMLGPLAIALWLGSGVLSAVHSEDESVANEIRSRKYVVVDDTGEDRAEFGIMKNGEAGMVVWNKNKSTAVSVSIDRYGMPRIAFESSKGETLVELGMLDDKYPVFIMSDAEGRRRLGMVVTDTGSATLRFYDTNKRNRCEVSLGRDGDPRIVLRDSKGNARASLMLDVMGTSALSLLDHKSKERIVFQVDGDDHADAAIFGPDGRATWRSAKP